MANPVYSVVLFEQALLNGSTTFDVTEFYVCVIRDIEVHHHSTAAAGNFGLVADTGVWLAFTTFAASVGAHWSWEGRIVQAASSVLTMTTTCPLDVHISGYLLQLP